MSSQPSPPARSLLALSPLTAFPAAIAGFVVPFLLAASYTLNHFYIQGASVWDAGWFAWLGASSFAWPMPNPPAIGGSFLAIHVSPVFFLLSGVKSVLPAMPAPIWFALTQGVWFGLLGLAASLCLPLPVAVLLMFNGIALATIGFPHIEIAIPPLLFLALIFRPRGWWFAPVLLLLFTVREDAGLHAALAFAALAALRAVEARSLRAAAPDTAITLVCLAAGFAAIAVQHGLPGGGGALSGTYLGSPALAHIDADFVGQRLHYLFKDRSYVWGPLLLLGVFAWVWRDLRLAAGLVISLPWLALSFVAKSHQAGEMWSYYSIPLMAGLCWPMLCAASFGGRRRRHMVAQAALAALSIVLFIGSGGNHDRRPWSSAGLAWIGRIAPTETALDAILARRAAFGPIVVDDATAALRLGAFSADELRYDFAFTDAELARVNTLILRPGRPQSPAMRASIARAGLTAAEPTPTTGDGGFRILHRPGF